MKIDRKTTLKDVAREANVSLSTASHAINGTAPLTTQVRERVLEAARALGYLENRRQKATIATLRVVLLAMTNDAAPQSDLNMVSWTMLNGFRRECERRGIRIVPYVSTTSRLDPVAVAAAAFVLTLPAVRTSFVAHSPSSAARSESTQARAPSLARLCLLQI